jgi:lysophospholipase L1-like esterase
MKIQRYVAIGDSQTEGLHDYHDNGVPRGWADRFAERLSEINPSLLYANLAIRGKRTFEVRNEQLDAALALDPDLATVVSGVNDVVRPGIDIDAVAGELESMYRALTSSGCRVLGCTFPLPAVGLTGRVAPTLRSLNVAIRAAAERHGVALVELEDVESASDLRLWSPDRIHLNPDGHRRLASAFEETLLGASENNWNESLPAAPEPSRARRISSEIAWVARFLVPKILRTLRGQSSGDGRSAKRPELGRLDLS